VTRAISWKYKSNAIIVYCHFCFFSVYNDIPCCLIQFFSYFFSDPHRISTSGEIENQNIILPSRGKIKMLNAKSDCIKESVRIDSSLSGAGNRRPGFVLT